MSESETQELAWLNFFESVVEKVDGRVCSTILLERDFSGLKDIFQAFDQFEILSRSHEREESAACLPEG